MGGEKPIIMVAFNHPRPPHANKIFKEFEEIFDCRERSGCARVGGRRVVGRELQIANWGLRIANCGSPASSLKQFKLKTEMDGRGMGAKE
jgi:hypothetical protein